MMKNRIFAELPRNDDRNGRTAGDAVPETADHDTTGLPGQWLSRVENGIGEHPAISLFVALSTGVMIGWLIKRK